MGCETIRSGSIVGFICTRGRRPPKCSECKAAPSTKQCDYPLRGKVAGRTCSRHLCARCAVTAGQVKRIEAVTAAELQDPMVATAVRSGAMPARELVDDTVDYCPAHARKIDDDCDAEAAVAARSGGGLERGGVVGGSPGQLELFDGGR